VLAHPVLIDRDRTAVVDPSITLKSNAKNKDDLRHYFEYSPHGVEVEDGLQEIAFGEFLVEQKVVDRYQLFRALQMQDRIKGVRIGECVAALGYAPIGRIEKMFEALTKLQAVTVG
jgi:hypothetical protein